MSRNNGSGIITRVDSYCFRQNAFRNTKTTDNVNLSLNHNTQHSNFAGVFNFKYASKFKMKACRQYLRTKWYLPRSIVDHQETTGHLEWLQTPRTQRWTRTVPVFKNVKGNKTCSHTITRQNSFPIYKEFSNLQNVGDFRSWSNEPRERKEVHSGVPAVWKDEEVHHGMSKEATFGTILGGVAMRNEKRRQWWSHGMAVWLQMWSGSEEV